MAHIHTEFGEHDHTASAFIVRTDTSEPKLLLHRHKLLNKFLQIGGHIELKENPWQTIAHELQEESGYDIGQLKILQPKDRIHKLSDANLHPYPVCINTHQIYEGHSHTDIEYAFVTNTEPVGDIHSGESTTIRLFTQTELAALSDKETYANIREIGAFIFDVCLKEWEAVDISNFTL